MSNDN